MLSRDSRFGFCVLALLVVACGDETIRVAVSADDRLGADVTFVDISISRNGERKFSQGSSTVEVALPASLLLENGDPDNLDDDIRIVVEGTTGSGPIVRSAVVQFSDEESVLLRLPLCASCLNESCGEGKTCVDGACASERIDVDDLPVDEEDASLQGECDGSGGSGGAGGGGGGGQGGCTGVCGEPDCGDCPVVAQVAAGGFTIDATEVTRGAYEYWLALNPNPDQADLGNICTASSQNVAFSTLISPDGDCMASQDVCQSGCTEHPMVCVTSCAAEAYCAWANKHLCSDSPNEWISACRDGPLAMSGTYPYGNAHEPGRCNDQTRWTSATPTTVPVGSLPTCVGSYAGLFDMSGNVFEHTSDCAYMGGGPTCTARGGSYENDSGLECSASYLLDFVAVATNVGFRCCDDG